MTGGYLLPPAFIVSIGALAFLFYSHSDRSERSALMTGKAFLYGSAVAVITFLAYDYMERYGYQFMALGTAVLIIFVLLTVTSRRKAEFN
ncbi:hypothetical protein [Thermogymnomonas acidicola]|uniref:hypothetical protein n=1 Tax=Thermogymnomonas acidicola TaxID=399579 RepID=UPI001494D6A3|nr:hypothetical protein [Thermogymnomonas acidicola]